MIEQIHLERQQAEKERINAKNKIELNDFNIKQMKVEVTSHCQFESS